MREKTFCLMNLTQKIGIVKIFTVIAGFILGVLIVSGCGEITEEISRKPGNGSALYRFIYNNDGTYVLGNSLHGGRPLTIEDVKDYVDIVAGTPVTTYAICANSLMPYYQSRFERSIGCLGEGQEDTGESSHVSDNIKLYGQNLLALREQGTDIVEICVDRAKEQGLEAFVSMRMNDLHFNVISIRNPLEQSDFWLEHPEFFVGEHPGWHADGAFNFAHEEVRRYKLNIIREICQKFNLDGIELDFMRFPVYFPYGEEEKYVDVMTDFVANARKIVNEEGQRRNRPILLAVRVPSNWEYCLHKGFQIRAWMEKDLIDIITVSAFYIDDPLLPVRKFKEALDPIDIPVYASMDNGLYSPREPRTQGMYRAAATRLLSEGADGLYLFNFFFSDVSLIQDRTAKPQEGEIVCLEPDPELLNDLESLQSLAGRNKIYSLGDGRVDEYEYKHESPLPLTLSQGDETNVHILLPEDFSRKIPQNAWLFIRETKGAKLSITFNGTILKDSKDPDIIRRFRRDTSLGEDEEVRVCVVPAKLLKESENNIGITSQKEERAELTRIELAIGYGLPEECGYY